MLEPQSSPLSRLYSTAILSWLFWSKSSFKKTHQDPDAMQTQLIPLFSHLDQS